MSKFPVTQEDRDVIVSNAGVPEVTPNVASSEDASAEQAVARLRLLWEHRGLLFRGALIGLVLSTLIAFLIPTRYEATTQLNNK